MGFFQKQAEKYQEQFYSNLMPEDIPKWEAQGVTFTDEQRARAEENKRAKAAEHASRPVYHLDRLEPFKAVPRGADDPFVIDCAGKLPALGKEKYLAQFQNAPLLFSKVVQANHALWETGDYEGLPAVFVFALDDAHRYDTDWLDRTAAAIQEMKKGGDVPKDCKKFILKLREDKGSFCFKLGESLSGGADAWCVTKVIEKQTELPNCALSRDGLMPWLLRDNLREGYFAPLALIPSQYYI